MAIITGEQAMTQLDRIFAECGRGGEIKGQAYNDSNWHVIMNKR